jgi:hypothetical protein
MVILSMRLCLEQIIFIINTSGVTNLNKDLGNLFLRKRFPNLPKRFNKKTDI